MNTIKSILERKKVQVTSSIRKRTKLELLKNERPLNENWEVADEFARYVGLKTPFVLKLFRIYGRAKVLSLRSWLKDAPCDPLRRNGLVVWKLKQMAQDEAKLGA